MTESEANANMIEAADEIDRRIKMKWQPIETAPKDGTEILVFCPYEGVGSVFWRKSKNNHRGGWQVCSFDVADFETNAEPCPTHWLPLPAAPTPEPHVRVWQLGDGPILGKIRPTQMREDEKEKEIEMATTLNDKMKKIGAQRRKKIEKRAAELIAEEILRDLREASIHMEGVLKATAVRLGETEQELERLTELRATQHALEEGYIERHAAAERYRAALEQIVAYFDGGGTANDPAILSCARRALERQTP